MTTEILRSMLYKGADLIRDVEFVIFDEVHYVNDAEVRATSGRTFAFVTWTDQKKREAWYGKKLSSCYPTMSVSSSYPLRFQTQRSLPTGLGTTFFLFLGIKFTGNTRRTKKKDIYVISTAQRPVPLEHFLYAGRELYKIVDADRKFLSQG